MEDFMDMLCHLTFTGFAWMTSHWSEVGAGVLMLLQGVLLVYKLLDRRHKNKEV